MASTSTMKGAMAPKMFKSMAAPGSRWQKNLKIWGYLAALKIWWWDLGTSGKLPVFNASATPTCHGGKPCSTPSKATLARSWGWNCLSKETVLRESAFGVWICWSVDAHISKLVIFNTQFAQRKHTLTDYFNTHLTLTIPGMFFGNSCGKETGIKRMIWPKSSKHLKLATFKSTSGFMYFSPIFEAEPLEPEPPGEKTAPPKVSFFSAVGWKSWSKMCFSNQLNWLNL